MKRFLALCLSMMLAVSFLADGAAAEAKAKEPKAKPSKSAKSTKAAKAGKRGRLVHMVSFKFKPEATSAQIKEVEHAFAALPQTIPVIRSFEWGTNVSPEKLDKGFTHGFVLTFKDDKDRDAYLVHPEHKKFGELVGKVLADVFVVDFWVKD